MANRTTLDVERPAKTAKSTKKPAGGNGKNGAGSERERVYELFRRWGFYEANLDPLDFLKPLKHPELDLAGPDADEAPRDLLRHHRRGVHAPAGSGAA